MNRIQTKSSVFGTRTGDLSDGKPAQDRLYPPNRQKFPDLPPSQTRLPGRVPQELALNVAFTSGPATTAALRRASEMAQGLGAKLHVIVPQVVPYGRQLDDPDVDTSFTVAHALDAAHDAGLDVDVHVVLCRDRVEGLHSALGPDGILLIGGVSRWWPFPEHTLVRRLAALGHKVLFVEGSN